MLAASVTLLVASDHEHRAFLHPSEAVRRCTGGVVTMARLSSFLARRPHDSSPRGVAHLLRAHRHPLHRPRRPHPALQRAPRRPPTPGHTTGRRPRQRDPRRSLSSTRTSARSSPSANPRRGRGSRGANPGSARRALGAPGECAAHPRSHAWFPTNVARNSPLRYSNFEIRPLQFQRFLGISKTDQGKLRATFLGGTVAPGRRGRGWPGGYAHSCGPGTPGHDPFTRVLPVRVPSVGGLRPPRPLHAGGGSPTGAPTSLSRHRLSTPTPSAARRAPRTPG